MGRYVITGPYGDHRVGAGSVLPFPEERRSIHIQSTLFPRNPPKGTRAEGRSFCVVARESGLVCLGLRNGHQFALHMNGTKILDHIEGFSPGSIHPQNPGTQRERLS